MTATYALNAYLNFPRIRRATPADVPAIRALQAESLRTLGLVPMRKDLVRTVRARAA